MRSRLGQPVAPHVHPRPSALRTAVLWSAILGIVLSVAAGCGGNQSEMNPADGGRAGSPKPPESARLQVSLFWGGGERRAWRGEFGVGMKPGARGRILWLFMTDFEAGDHCLAGGRITPPFQLVPNGWRRSVPADIEERTTPGILAPRGGGNGASLQTLTDGDADGVCFELIGSLAVPIVLDMGPNAVLETTIAELLEGPATVRVDDSGNWLVAQAVRVTGNAPEFVLHGEREARRTSLHTHSCFSTNQMALEPVVASLRPFVNSVWWTDHIVGDERSILGGDFEKPAVVEAFWGTHVGKATELVAKLDGDTSAGANAFRLEIESPPDAPGIGSLFQTNGAGEFNLGLCAEPRLRWSFKSLPRSDGKPSAVFVFVTLHSGRTIRYVFGGTPRVASAIDIRLDLVPGEWQTVERDIAKDAGELHEFLGTDGFRRVTFGVIGPPGQTAGVLFDEIELVVPEPREVVRLQEERLGKFKDPRCYAALEQSAWTGIDTIGPLFPHLTALVPTGAPELFVGNDHELSHAERRAFSQSIHDAGGVVGTHHMQLNQHYEAFLEGKGLGADMYEIGGAWWHVPAFSTVAERLDRDAHEYPRLAEDEVYPLLVRWDRLTARGLFLTGYGAPDLHQRFDGPSYGWLNRWLTWVFADDGSPEAELRALRSGQACASEWRSSAILTLEVAGKPWMGKLVVTDGEQVTVTAKLSGAIPGSRVRWIRGALVRDVAGATGFEPERIGFVREDGVAGVEFQSSLEIDTSRGVFVRAELLNPAGHIVALSNPVSFAPYWPESWPAGRIAFDWGGVTLESSVGILLTDAHITSEGQLELSGIVGSGGGDLVIRGPNPALAWSENREVTASPVAGSSTLELHAPSPGSIHVRVALAAPLPRGSTGEILAIPERKPLVFSIEVGLPESEGDWSALGFGEPILGPMLLSDREGSYRAMTRDRARFELDIPTGETTWLKLRTFAYTPVSGQLSMDGEKLRSFNRTESMTFELPPSDLGSTESRRRLFEIKLDPHPPLPKEIPALRLQRIELYRGSGVVDW